MTNESRDALVGCVSDNIHSTGKIMCVSTVNRHLQNGGRKFKYVRIS